MAEDHPVYRDGLRQIVASDQTLKIIRETGNGAEALRLARELKPDLLILDMDLPGMNGLDIARARQKERLGFEIIFLTMYREEDMFTEAMELGAKGYVLKESAAAEILQSIHAVASGRALHQPVAFRFARQAGCPRRGSARRAARRGESDAGGTAHFKTDRLRQNEQGNRRHARFKSAHR